MEVLSWILAIILAFLVWLFFHLRRFRGCLEDTGLPMVKPFFCFGSAPRLFNKIYYNRWYVEKHRELGRTFVSYTGKYFSVALILVSTNPQYGKILFILELQVQYVHENYKLRTC